MTPIIDREKTGKQIRRIMELRGLSVHDVQRFLSLGCVQSVYHWFDGKSMPTIDNLYALSELFQVPRRFNRRGTIKTEYREDA